MLEVRHRATAWLIIAELGIAAVYAFFPPRKPPPNVVSVVRYIEQLGPPTWVVAFAIISSLLLAARITKQWLVQAHNFCYGVAIFYTAALGAGVLLTKPFALTVPFMLGIALCVGHYTLSRWYASAGTER